MSETKERLKGLLEQIRFSSANGFTVATLRTLEGTSVTVVGKLFGIRAGDTIEIEGTYVENPKFGMQFQIEKSHAIFPEDDIGAFRFLERLPFLGQHRAHKLLKTFGRKETFAILNDATRLKELQNADPGFTPSRQKAIYAAYQEISKTWNAKVALQKFSLSDEQISRILRLWGENAVAEVKKNPFLLMQLPGINFAEADRIAFAMGYAPDSDVRVKGVLLYLLGEEEIKGHTFIEQNELLIKVTKSLEVDWERARDILLEFLEEEGSPLAKSKGERIHLQELKDAETEIALWIGG